MKHRTVGIGTPPAGVSARVGGCTLRKFLNPYSVQTIWDLVNYRIFTYKTDRSVEYGGLFSDESVLMAGKVQEKSASVRQELRAMLSAPGSGRGRP